MEYSELEMLESLFDSVGVVTVNGNGFKPTFDYGTVEDLNKFLRIKKTGSTNTYPLIWVTTPFKTSYHNVNETKSSVTLILATNSDSVSLNKDRAKTTIKSVLLPLISNIKEAIIRSPYIIGGRDRDYDLTYHFNYAVEETRATTIWDAIELTLELKFKICNYNKN